jgi:N-methylhydantoinase A
MSYRIGIDIGGTFTDAIALDDRGNMIAAKSTTTPQNLTTGFFACLDEIARQLKTGRKKLLSETTAIVHGTTLADLTIATRSGPRTGIIATSGHKDTIQLRRVRKDNMWDWRQPFPQPLVPRHLRTEVAERIGGRGEVVRALDETSARKAITHLKKMGVTSIAVTLIFSFLNPAHEKRVREIIREEYPQALVTLSHEVLAVSGEYERFSTAVIDAYVRPVVAEYIKSLQKSLKRNGFNGQLYLMQNNGGVETAGAALQKPGTLVMGGKGALPAAALAAGASQGVSDLLSIDMGGTAFDIAIVANGQSTVKNESVVANHRFSLPIVEVETLGAGGGSLAWFDLGDTLHIGPGSAGASPGPACYAAGGAEATFTDVALVLGYLAPDLILSTGQKLNKRLAEKAIREKVTGKLGLDIAKSAAAMYKVNNSVMASGIAHAFTTKGYNPCDFTLCAGGAAGPLCALRIAEELDMKRVIIPKYAPVYTSLGMLGVDVRHDFLRHYSALASDLDLGEVKRIYREMEKEANHLLDEEDFPKSQRTLTRTLRMRYYGQFRDLEVPWPNGPITRQVIAGGIANFHRRHKELFGSCNENYPLEIMKFGLTATGKMPEISFKKIKRGTADASAALKGKRQAYFEEFKGFKATRVYDGARLLAGNILKGPCIVEEKMTTIVIPPGFKMRVDARGNYISLP